MFSVRLRNHGGREAAGVVATLASGTPGVSIDDPAFSYGVIGAGENADPDRAVPVVVGDEFADGDTIMLELTVSDADGHTWLCVMPMQVAAPLVACVAVRIDDETSGNGNGIAEPGESIEVRVVLENRGRAPARDVTVSLTSNDTTLVPVERSVQVGTLTAGMREAAVFPVLVDGASATPALGITTGDG